MDFFMLGVYVDNSSQRIPVGGKTDSIEVIKASWHTLLTITRCYRQQRGLETVRQCEKGVLKYQIATEGPRT
jgi:hypothetical protein